MAAKPKIYIVSMHRLGLRDSPSYVPGVFSKKHAAMQAGRIEQTLRGNKYMPEVIEADLNATGAHLGKVIVALKATPGFERISDMKPKHRQSFAEIGDDDGD